MLETYEHYSYFLLYRYLLVITTFHVFSINHLKRTKIEKKYVNLKWKINDLRLWTIIFYWGEKIKQNLRNSITIAKIIICKRNYKIIWNFYNINYVFHEKFLGTKIFVLSEKYLINLPHDFYILSKSKSINRTTNCSVT